MRISTALGLAGAVQLAAAYDAPPAAIVQFCGARKQFPQKVNGKWKCVQTSDICSPNQDLVTLHQDRESGTWMCCPEDEILNEEGDACRSPKEESPATCTDRIAESGLEAILNDVFKDCFPGDRSTLEAFVRQYIYSLHNGLTLVESIYENSCPRPTQSSSPVPSHSPVPRDTIDLAQDWFKCPKNNSPCMWLSLENNKKPKILQATGYEYQILPNPNVHVDDYRYPFDTWVVKRPEDDLRMYVEGEAVKPNSDGISYLIPAGTHANDVLYRCIHDSEVHYYGSCSVDTPCVDREILVWTQVTSLTKEDRDQFIDVSALDFDVVFTVSDTSITTEQYIVLADGREVGRTHGRPTLGDDKYNTAHIANVDVGIGASGALKSISNDGFWGSFLIPKDTQRVTIHMGVQGVESPGWPYYVLEYRIDHLCQC
ncbi:hypothetical protein PT974_04547 [Cladobotryum mycophilum]|uniref:Uncharacterized protein n=1 Tax=Cladobotryum mycophilum TaxID=491253 RepID=A0ABR0SVF6_9HYPO